MTELATQDDTLPPRGNFPKGPQVETREQRRARYELWVLATRAPQPDYEWQSITFYRGKTKMVAAGYGSAEKKEVLAQPSRRLCVNSACWKCEGGGEDANAQDRIANCARARCGLHQARPYQPQAAGTQSLKAAIRTYCLECARGSYQEVRLCHAVTCPVWPIRPGANGGAEPGSGDESEAALPVDGE